MQNNIHILSTPLLSPLPHMALFWSSQMSRQYSLSKQVWIAWSWGVEIQSLLDAHSYVSKEKVVLFPREKAMLDNHQTHLIFLPDISQPTFSRSENGAMWVVAVKGGQQFVIPPVLGSSQSPFSPLVPWWSGRKHAKGDSTTGWK